MTTWSEVLADIADEVLSDAANGNLDLADRSSWDDYAHERADGSQYVIWTWRARELWANCSEVRAYEDDAVAVSLADSGQDVSVDGVITASVYLALRSAILDAVGEAAEPSTLVWMLARNPR